MITAAGGDGVLICRVRTRDGAERVIQALRARTGRSLELQQRNFTGNPGKAASVTLL